MSVWISTTPLLIPGASSPAHLHENRAVGRGPFDVSDAATVGLPSAVSSTRGVDRYLGGSNYILAAYMASGR
ncbi:MAG: hypothetical protein QOH97_2861 [Actinoplanes sp.]|nr:hypothetical protein [Actinoplanes sp.]